MQSMYQCRLDRHHRERCLPVLLGMLCLAALAGQRIRSLTAPGAATAPLRAPAQLPLVPGSTGEAATGSLDTLPGGAREHPAALGTLQDPCPYLAAVTWELPLITPVLHDHTGKHPMASADVIGVRPESDVAKLAASKAPVPAKIHILVGAVIGALSNGARAAELLLSTTSGSASRRYCALIGLISGQISGSLSSIPPHARRVMYLLRGAVVPSLRAYSLSDADWCLQSDVMPDSAPLPRSPSWPPGLQQVTAGLFAAPGCLPGRSPPQATAMRCPEPCSGPGARERWHQSIAGCNTPTSC